MGAARENVDEHLHPVFLSRMKALEDAIRRSGEPIFFYEGWRSPERQVELYAVGRVSGVGTPGRHSTFEKAWHSMHQHGLAADFVFRINGQWEWPDKDDPRWNALTAGAAASGLEVLKFERPHVQLPGFNARKITAGEQEYPRGGGASRDEWEANLDRAIVAWGQHEKKDRYGIVHPGAPRLLTGRPAQPVPPGMVYDAEKGLCYPE